MKQTVLFLSFLSLLFLGSCASDDSLTEFTPDPEPKVPTIPFMGTITTGDEPSAVAQAVSAPDSRYKALSDQGNTLKATWEVGDEMALIVSGQLCKATVTEVNENKANISADVPATVTDGTEARVIYPYSAVDASTLDVKTDLLAEQDGTLETIARDFDVCAGTGTLSISDSKACLTEDVTMAEQFCIWRLATQYNGSALNISKLKIEQGGESYIVNLSSEASSGIYVALKPAAATAHNFHVLTSNGAHYLKNYSSVTLAAQKFYRSTVSLEFDEFWFVFTDYYMWDAKEWYWYGKETFPTRNNARGSGYPTSEDPDRWANSTAVGPANSHANNSSASNSAQDMPCYNAMQWYLSEDVYYDNETVWTLCAGSFGADTYTGGIWLKKWDKISNKPNNSTIFDCPSPPATTYSMPSYSKTLIEGKPSNIDDYFFLPALGNMISGYLYQVGMTGEYWMSSLYPNGGTNYGAVKLEFNNASGAGFNYTSIARGCIAGHRPDGSNWFK